MQQARIRHQLRDLFAETGAAHHEAFAHTDGADPEWPLWYADYLQGPLGEALSSDFTKSQLVYCLMDADFEFQARADGGDWQDFFAGEFAQRYAPCEEMERDKLALYYFPTCPFCQLVLRAIDHLGLDVELRNIRADEQHWSDLVAERGRPTVPVLHITAADGEERWMPESRDIVAYLAHTYGGDE